MTQAENIAEQFDNDGQCFWNSEDQHIESVCEDAAIASTQGAGDLTRHVFDDGSAIVIAEGGWDIEGDQPFSWGGAQ